MSMKMELQTQMKDVQLWKKKVRSRMTSMIRKDIRKTTISGVAHDGSRFTPYKTGSARGRVTFEKTRRRKGVKVKVVEGKSYGPDAPVTLVRSGAMMRGLRSKNTIDLSQVMMKGSKAFIARFQQNGTKAGAETATKRRKKKGLEPGTGAGTGAIPARPWIVMRDSTIKLVQIYIMKEVKRAFDATSLKDLTAATKLKAAD